MLDLTLLMRFQFPSSGKLLPNLFDDLSDKGDMHTVSIPFKRETPSKLKLMKAKVVAAAAVSIPFKRETPSKLFL